MLTPQHNTYIGRFAPSPTGPLHFGSLATAVGSFLHARQHHGLWRVRIEDIDQPRCVANADQWILASLQAHGLLWDGEVCYQSQRLAVYQQALQHLTEHLYSCTCTRADIKANGGQHDKRCRTTPVHDKPAAIRFTNNEPICEFMDLLQGPLTWQPEQLEGDFIVKRKDGLFAYHIAVVTDDIEQKVTHIIRGADLLDTTPVHLTLYATLGVEPPAYLHLPVICQSPGKKLSKQNHAAAIDDRRPTQNLLKVFHWFGFSYPQSLVNKSPSIVLEWAIQHINIDKMIPMREIIVPEA